LFGGGEKRMAVVVAGSRARAEQARMQWREQEPRSPDMAAPPPRPPPRPRPARAAVVYYLARNGHLEHPHFMEVALSCPDGLYLRGTNALLCSAHTCFVLVPDRFAVRFIGVRRAFCVVRVRRC
jgi:hypothetical protein